MDSPKKIRLKKIDVENWRFVLYESEQGNWFGSFVYSPQSFIDLNMLIKLSTEEQQNAKGDRNYLIDLADKIRHSYSNYTDRALNKDDFLFPPKE